MIEKMQIAYVITSVSRKEQMLRELCDLGLLHLAEKKAADRSLVDRFSTLSKTASTLQEYLPDKAEPATKLLDDQAFQALYKQVLDALDTKNRLLQQHAEISTELERIRPWGDFFPDAVRDIQAQGYDLHFYRFTKKEFEQAKSASSVKLIRLGSVERQITAAVLGVLPPELSASEFPLPKKSISELTQDLKECNAKEKSCDQLLKKAALFGPSFQQQLLRLQNEEEFSSAEATAESDNAFVWISGYIPAQSTEAFRKMALENQWAWAIQDVDEDDENVPTKLRYGRVSRLIKPVFDILGVLPGYREQDVSLWFFLFFILFFAMIIGDGGYGLLILLGTLVFAAKKKEKSDTVFLLLVLSIGTILWGALTGTWFGLKAAMDIPILKALVIPSLANYPECFGVTASAQQNTIIKFSFSIGAIQMALGSILSIRKKIPEKDLSWIADSGWAVSVCAMYLLALHLVIGESIPLLPVFALVLTAFVLVLLFGGMEPDKTFRQGLLAGLANGFTVFLDTISCFGNVMSYIRLFAVGMAGLAISQSFNGLATGFHGPLIILGVLVFVTGHAINLVMCFLSVVVHGVRLNVLEFSGQVGLEWTGIPYEPFRKRKKISK